MTATHAANSEQVVQEVEKFNPALADAFREVAKAMGRLQELKGNSPAKLPNFADEIFEKYTGDKRPEGTNPEKAILHALYTYQLEMYKEVGKTVSQPLRDRALVAAGEWDRSVKAAAIDREILGLIDRIQKATAGETKLNAKAVSTLKTRLEEACEFSPNWYWDKKLGMAVSRHPVSLRPVVDGVVLKTTESVKRKLERSAKEAQWQAWEKAGGKRVTVAAHVEKLPDGREIFHKEYSYVTPPKKDKA